MKKKTIAILLIAILAFAVVGCGSNKPVEPAQNDQEEIVEKDVEEKEDKENEKDKGTEVNVGDEFNIGEWTVALDEFNFNKSVEDSIASSSAKDGNKFLILNFSVTNNGTEEDSFVQMFGGTIMQAIYDEKYEYNPSTTLIDGDLSNIRVEPLATAKGFVVIEVPEKVVEATESLALIIESSDGKEKVQIKLR